MGAAEKCSICGAKARHYQRYSGRSYCGRCLTRSLRKRVWREVRRNHLIEDGESILFAVSGGKDSIACLDMVYDLESKRNVKMAVITVDEGIEGYRPGGIESARKAAGERDLEFHLISFEDAFGFGLDSIIERLGTPKRACTYCGVLRRWVLNRRARELGADDGADLLRLLACDEVVDCLLYVFLAGSQLLGPYVVDDCYGGGRDEQPDKYDESIEHRVALTPLTWGHDKTP